LVRPGISSIPPPIFSYLSPNVCDQLTPFTAVLSVTAVGKSSRLLDSAYDQVWHLLGSLCLMRKSAHIWRLRPRENGSTWHLLDKGTACPGYGLLSATVETKFHTTCPKHTNTSNSFNRMPMLCCTAVTKMQGVPASITVLV
jgi:hypothetical protein